MRAKNAIPRRMGLKHGLMMAITLALIFGMLLGVAEPATAQRPSCDTSGTTVQFQGETCTGSTCTWSYNVCQTGFALSHWVLGLCDCFESLLTEDGAEVGYLDAQNNRVILPKCTVGQTAPCWELGLDHTTGLFGLKWDNLPGLENECWTFYLTINQNLGETTLNWTSKFAACAPGTGAITGPECPCGCGQILAFKYYDVNQNRVYDEGDYELGGWEIRLDDGSWVMTDEIGFVDFGCQAPGTYTVCERLKDGWVNSEPGDGEFCHEIYLQANEQERVHFGNYEDDQLLAYIRASKYYDYDGNGQCDDACCPLDDWVICLDGYDDCKTTRYICMICGGCTDYWEVEPGTHMLCEIPKVGWTNTDPGVVPPCKEVTVEPDHFLCVPFGNWETQVLDGQGDDEDCGTSVVGGEVYPVDKAAVLAPWLSLALIIVIGGSILAMRRRTTRQE